jgi:hypothetical protein
MTKDVNFSRFGPKIFKRNCVSVEIRQGGLILRSHQPPHHLTIKWNIMLRKKTEIQSLT